MMTTNEWLQIVRYNPAAFGVENGFTDLGDLHNDWIRSFLFAQESQTLQAHRGSYKTTCLAVALSLIIVVFPQYTMIFLRKTDTDVIEVISLIKKLLQSDMYRALARALYVVPLTLTKETTTEISTNLKASPGGSSQLLGLGIKASITGKHADIVITDDIVNIKDRVSRAERELTKTAYQELQNVCNRDGRFINTGTPWHKEDAFALMPNIAKYDCYKTGLIKKEQLQRLKQSMSLSLFAANYELKHIADENAMFVSVQWADDEDTHKIFNGICHIDAGYGGADSTAFTIGKKVDDKIYLYGRLWEKHVDDVLPQIEVERVRLRAGTLYSEKNADKGYLLKKIKKPARNYHEHTNKYIKISTHLRGNWHNVFFVKGTDPEYVSQILDYSEFSEHDDAPDSAACTVRILTAVSRFSFE